MRRNIVLLTATITPGLAQGSLTLFNPQERLDDYKKALTFYQQLLQSGGITGVIFAENSGHDLNPLRELFPNPNIEWLSFCDLDYPSSYHRGYGEFRLIDRAMSESKTVADLSSVDAVWKVTGRYIIENLARVVRLAPQSFGLYCRSDNRWTEMSLMAWSCRGHATLIKGVWKEFATGMAPELILAPRLATAIANRSECRIVRRFVWPPLIVGRRGTDGTPFTSWRARWKFRALLLPKVLQIALRFTASADEKFHARSTHIKK